MNDLLEEANSDYIYQRRILAFKKALPFITIATVILIIIIGIKDLYASRELENLQKRTDLLIETLHKAGSQSHEMRDEILKSLAKEKDGISDIARLELIYDLQNSKDKVHALEQIKNLAEAANTPIVKNIAKLEYVGMLLDYEKLSQEQISRMQSFLTSIDKTQGLYQNAQIYNALFNIKINNFLIAKEILKKLSADENLAESIQSQHEAIINYINERESK